VFGQLTKLLRRRRVATVAELREFLTREAIYLSQKATIEYCHARAGLGWQRLLTEPAFVAALEACRWRAMAAVLADMIVVAEGFFRPHAVQDREDLAEGLAAAFFEIVDGSPLPTTAPDDRTALGHEIGARLGRAQLASVRNPGEIAKTSGERVFDLLPIHPSLRVYDREVVVNSVRFGMVAFSETLARAVDSPVELARLLIASGRPLR
jgi:hypothetical protein